MSSDLQKTEDVAAASISGPPQSSSDLKVEGDSVAPATAENGEKAEGGDKTVFDDANAFNVKVCLAILVSPFLRSLAEPSI
jgi:hypothetical protein